MEFLFVNLSDLFFNQINIFDMQVYVSKDQVHVQQLAPGLLYSGIRCLKIQESQLGSFHSSSVRFWYINFSERIEQLAIPIANRLS